LNRNTGMRKKMFSCFVIAAALLTFPIISAFAAIPSDIAGHWAGAQIAGWVDKGLVKGYPDGTFRPDDNVTRAEFMALVNGAFGYTSKAAVSYKDVPAGAWYADAVAKAGAAGYIGGYGDGTIRPDNPITRAEAATVVMRIKGLAADSGAAAKFTDAEAVPAWSRGAVGAVAASGIMGGYPGGSFRARDFISRAEAVVALNKALVASLTYDKAGIYGPESGTRIIAGPVIIKAAGVTLRNTVVKGNLTIAKEVGDGEVRLEKVVVNGETYIQGGGFNSIYFIDTETGKVYVQKDEGPVRIVASGSSEIQQLIVQTSVKVEEADLSGKGVEGIVVEKKGDGAVEISLAGVTVEKIEVKSEGVIINADSGTKVTELIASGAKTVVNTRAGTQIATLVANASIDVNGQGAIQKAEINAGGVSFDSRPKSLDVAAGVSAPTVGAGSSGGSSGGGGGGGGGGGSSTVTATALGAATAQVTLGSINYDYDFYADEAKTTPVNYAAALLAPYYLDPGGSTVQLFGDGEGEESATVSLSDLDLSDDGQAAYEGMDDMKNVFEFDESDDWIPGKIVLNLKSRTTVDGKDVASPWEKTIEIEIGEAFNVFALNADKDQLTIYNSMGQSLAGEALNNITGDLLLQAEGWLGSEISWESSDEDLISISDQPVTYNFGGFDLEFYEATVIRSVYSDETATLTATLSMGGGQDTLAKEFNLTVKQEEGATPPELSSATIDFNTLTLSYGESLDESSVPDAADFAVTVNGEYVGVSGVVIDGAGVTLTVVDSVYCGDEVRVSYIPPETNPIKGLAGNEAEGLNNVQAANITSGAGVTQVSPDTLYESSANNGAINSEGDTITVIIENGIFAADIAEADVTAANLPGGLDFTVTRDSDIQLTIAIIGAAGSHDDTDSVGNLTFTIAAEKVRGADGNLTTGSISIIFDPVG